MEATVLLDLTPTVANGLHWQPLKPITYAHTLWQSLRRIHSQAVAESDPSRSRPVNR